MRRTISLILLLCLTNLAVAEDGFPSFEAKVLDANIGKVCYAVTLADVNGDKKQDIVAVSDTRVLWYENPSWKSRVIISEQTPKDNVCIAPMDIDGDGSDEIVLEVLGEESVWLSILRRQGGSWVEGYRDPCGLPPGSSERAR